MTDEMLALARANAAAAGAKDVEFVEGYLEQVPLGDESVGCVAGALTERDFRLALERSGLDRIDIRETHRVREHATAATIRAQQPGPACCGPAAIAGCCDPPGKEDCCGAPKAEGPPATCGCTG
jgi:hypothetical protein